MPVPSDDQRFIEIAIEQARLGLDEGGVPIGAVLVADGKVDGFIALHPDVRNDDIDEE